MSKYEAAAHDSCRSGKPSVKLAAMRDGYELEQVFIKRKGGQLEFLFVSVAPSGALKREAFPFPTSDLKEGVQRAARFLSQRGDIDKVTRLRLRIDKAGTLSDDASLKKLFQDTFTRDHF